MSVKENNQKEQVRRSRISHYDRLLSLTITGRSSTMNFYTDLKYLHPTIRRTFSDMELIRSVSIHSRVGIAWVSSLRAVQRVLPYEGLVNHVGNEFHFTDKLRLVELLRYYDRRNNVTDRRPVDDLFVDHPKSVPPTYDMISPVARQQIISEANENDMWIMKPPALNRGRGIRIIQGLSELKDVIDKKGTEIFKTLPKSASMGRYLIQKYIKNPLLINYKKFDIRSYLAIVATNPLLCYHQPGYIRISLYDYRSDDKRALVHLTNQCVQRRDERYEMEKEDTVWSINQLNDYLNTHYADHVNYKPDWALTELQEIQRRILRRVVDSARLRLAPVDGQFGLYGCDFMIDENLKVYLIEINLGPALDTNTKVLSDVIPKVLRETIRLAAECYDKKRCGIRYLPLLLKHSMKLVYASPFKPSINLPGPYTIERHLRRVQLIGRYPVDLKKIAIEKCLERNGLVFNEKKN